MKPEAGSPNPSISHPDALQKIMAEVVQNRLCTHCGTCVGLAPDVLEMQLTDHGPVPAFLPGAGDASLETAYAACPGKGMDYPGLNEFVLGKSPSNWLVGCYRAFYIGYSNAPAVRRQGASAGVITQTLLYLLDSGRIDGAVVLRHGWPEPWLSAPVIARTADEILASSQSVYVPTPVNTLLEEMARFDGRLAYVGLPDQVASLRTLQRLGHPGALKVDYVLGPYVGTMMYLGAIESYLRSNGFESLEDIIELRYRQGEWPGYLQIKTRSGRVLKADKFYYNYLIPFYITDSTLMSVDFTNELTDISVGDAWHPRYEGQGEGYSVVIARSERAEGLLAEMQAEGVVSLEETSVEDAMSMHGHMLDFKKRGAFIRLDWRRRFNPPVPDYGYQPVKAPIKRKLVEAVISSIFIICRTRPARYVVERIPLSVIGPLFNNLRKSWKAISRPTKRKGLGETDYLVTKHS
jgi:coenzyme F420 hydrogenase subunit beta